MPPLATAIQNWIRPPIPKSSFFSNFELPPLATANSFNRTKKVMKLSITTITHNYNNNNTITITHNNNNYTITITTITQTITHKITKELRCPFFQNFTFKTDTMILNLSLS